MTWTIERLPHFVAQDAALMAGLLIAQQLTIMRQGVANQTAYAEVYALVFGDLTPDEWVYLPPPEVARGITEIVRQVGLFVMADDAVALSALYDQSSWRAALPPVRIARLTPAGDPSYTPSRAQQLENRAAFEALVHRAAALAFAERLPSVVFDDLPKTLRLRETVTSMFDAVIAEASQRNDGAMRTLRQIQATTWQLIDRRHKPSEAGALVLAGPMPALVIAHLAYREARQAPRIRDANPTAHPNFMPGELMVPAWP
jgi:hypothetical protein